MNILNECTKQEVELIEKAGVIVEDKDYNQEDISKLQDQYSNVFRCIDSI